MEQRAQLVQQEYVLPEGILFVRITYILSAMVKAPVIAVCFLLVTLSSFAQYSFSSSSTKILDFTIYADGTTHVFYQTNVDPQSPDSTISLFGNTTDNLVVQDENGTLLSSKVNSNSAIIQTLGASEIKINYVFGVLGTSQTATLAIEKAQDFINNINSEGINTPLASAKLTEANSAFSQDKYSSAEVLANDAKNIASQEQQTALLNSKPTSDNIPLLIGGGIVGAVATAIILIKRTKNSKPVKTIEFSKNDNLVVPDKETIFRIKPELRQDDKDIVTFISENGGQAYESELRKKFLLPRTTTWRAVKRLEREGIIEIEKVDQQNRIKLRKMPEENQE